MGPVLIGIKPNTGHGAFVTHGKYKSEIFMFLPEHVRSAFVNGISIPIDHQTMVVWHHAMPGSWLGLRCPLALRFRPLIETRRLTVGLVTDAHVWGVEVKLDNKDEAAAALIARIERPVALVADRALARRRARTENDFEVTIVTPSDDGARVVWEGTLGEYRSLPADVVITGATHL